MKAIIGLGNPGRRYAATRHNVGFMVIDLLAKGKISVQWRQLAQAQVALCCWAEEEVLLVKPQTFMNQSGEAVALLAGLYQIRPGDLLVIYDDLDLRLGQLRLRRKGSAGGHNGVRSIISHLGTENFHRLRIGIDSPPAGVDVIDYVLSEFTPQEQEIVQDMLEIAAQAARVWYEEGIDKAMSRFNGFLHHLSLAGTDGG